MLCLPRPRFPLLIITPHHHHHHPAPRGSSSGASRIPLFLPFLRLTYTYTKNTTTPSFSSSSPPPKRRALSSTAAATRNHNHNHNHNLNLNLNLNRNRNYNFNRNCNRNHNEPLQLAIVGAGPAGFYAAHRVQARLPTARIDMYEALPVPYGLVRFGVAPDHPEVKNCQDRFAEVAQHPNFRYLGNMPIGYGDGHGYDGHGHDGHGHDTQHQHQHQHHLPLSCIVPHYHGLILSYGASRDRRLGIPGEDTLRGVCSARDFVGWYNGNPENRWAVDPDLLLRGEHAVVIGQGNVALDVARMLLCGVDRLRHTDVTEYALEALAKSRVRSVKVVGRRGPLQASFTIKELRELLTLPNTSFTPIPPHLLPPPDLIPTFPRPQKRILDILNRYSDANTTTTTTTSRPNSWSLDFLLAPTHFHSSPADPTYLSAVQFQHAQLPPPPDAYSPSARPTLLPTHTTLPATIAFKSIGYLSLPLPGSTELGIPFNPKRGLIPNEGGRVVIPQGEDTTEGFRELETLRVPGVYVAGWVKRGPTGVIASTMYDGFETADAVVEDWVSEEQDVEFMDYGSPGEEKRGWEAIEREAKDRGCRPVSWSEWKKIETAEKERGRRKGKEKEKFGSIQEMLQVLE